MRVFGIVFAVLMLVPVATADEHEEKLILARKKIAVMLREAEELEELGRTEDARRLRQKAEDMAAELQAYYKRLKKGEKKKAQKKKAQRKKGGDRHEGIMRGLENGIEALMALGKEEEAERLKRVLMGLRRRMEMGKGAKREHDVARGYIKVLRIAMDALLEGDREKAAHIVETEVHAIELRLKGRHKEIEHVPSPGNMVECLMLASEILKRHHKHEHAEHVQEMMQMYRKRHQKQAGARGREREHDRKREEGRHEHEARRERDRRHEHDGRREEDRREHEMRRERDRRHEHDGPRERGPRGRDGERRGPPPPIERMEQLTERVERLEEQLGKLTNLLEEMMQRERRRRGDR